MCKTNIAIEILKDDLNTQVASVDLQNAIFIENGEELCCLSKIIISGDYCREYTVASHVLKLDNNRILLDGKLLLVVLWSELAIIDIEQNKLLDVLNFNSWELFGVYKFKSGYFLHGEDSTRFLNGNFNLLWESGCVNIFVNYKTNCEVQIFDGYFTILDWYGYNHFYDENGELTSVYCPQYDCNKNDG